MNPFLCAPRWLLALVLVSACGLALAAGPAKEGNHAAAKKPSGAAVTLNLKDADISTLIATVSEVTGKNFVVDPRVKGKVTVISASPMDPAGVYETFLSVLEVNGYAAIPSGESIKIVPEANARTEGGGYVDHVAGAARDDMVTEVFSIQNASAAQLVAILRPLVAQTGHLAAYAPSNSLIISDRAANVERMARLIAQIDANGEREIQVVPLQYAAADDVVRVLTSLAQQARQSDPGAPLPALISDPRSNSVLIGGDSNEREKLLAVIKQLDQPQKENGNTQVIYLNYATAENLAPILEGYAQQVSKASASRGAQTTAAAQAPASPNPYAGAAGGNPEVRVLADKDTNALVITAPPKVMQQLRAVIAQLDIRRAQVLVEAIIAEVSANKSSELGLDYVAYDPNRIALAGILNQSTLSALQSASSLVGTSGTGVSRTTGIASAAAGLIGQGITGIAGYMGSNGAIFGALLHALQSDGDTNILSTPSLVTLDNQEAKIEVGQEVPFLTGQYANTGVANVSGVVNPFQTIDRKDVGLKLGITPTIGEGNSLRMKIELENSSLSSGTAGSANLITNKRTVSNTVSVDSGQILVIGGLIDDHINDSQSRIPLLSDIPLLGALFKARNITHTKSNLMVFIHPVILRSRDEGDYYTRLKYDQTRQAQLEAATGPIPLLGGQRPVLYRYDDYLKRNNQPQPTPPPSAAPAAAAPAPAPSNPPENPPPAAAPENGGAATPAPPAP
jgi:general secretion pathway protein D